MRPVLSLFCLTGSIALHLLVPEEDAELEEEAVDHLLDGEGLVLPGAAVPIFGGFAEWLLVPDEVLECPEAHFRVPPPGPKAYGEQELPVGGDLV